ncbi:TIGR03619 family F420-dependent LLM class oxidoreductase [Mycobacterium sp. C31M]
MRLSLTVPNTSRVATLVRPWQDHVGGREIGAIADLADSLGFHRLTVGEHFAIPRSHTDNSGAHYVHTTTALAYLAGHTERIRISPSVSIVPLQHPVVQAKQWATLDWLSGGRAELVVGVGWLKEEFEALGVDFRRRGRMVDEYIEAMLTIWSNEFASYKGQFVEFADIAAEPKPLQTGGLPLVFGGDAAATLRRVSRFGTGWSPFQTPPEKIREGIDRIKTHPSYRGQRIDVIYNLSFLRLGDAHTTKDDQHDFDTWNVQFMVDQIAAIGEMGVNEVTLPVPKVADYEQYLDRLRWLAEQVMPLLT